MPVPALPSPPHSSRWLTKQGRNTNTYRTLWRRANMYLYREKKGNGLSQIGFLCLPSRVNCDDQALPRCVEQRPCASNIKRETLFLHRIWIAVFNCFPLGPPEFNMLKKAKDESIFLYHSGSHREIQEDFLNLNPICPCLSIVNNGDTYFKMGPVLSGSAANRDH